jgi:hypothetical protein
VEPHRDVGAAAQLVERDARHRQQQVSVERDLAMDDAAGDGERELDHLPLGLARQLGAQAGKLVERLGQPLQHQVGALTGALSAGGLAFQESPGVCLLLDDGELRGRHVGFLRGDVRRAPAA